MRTPGFVAQITLLGSVLILAGCNGHSQQRDQLRVGFSSLEQKEYDQALAIADQYLREHPSGGDAAEALYLRGRAIEQRTKRSDTEASKNLSEAREAYQQALENKPSPQLEAYIRASLGNVSYWLGDYTDAEASWRDAYEHINRDDLKPWILYRIGLSQQRQAKWDDADSTFASVRTQYAGTDAANRAARHEGARGFYVQVGAFQNPNSAEQLAASLRGQGFPASRFRKQENGLQVVMAGPVQRYEDAVSMRNRLAGQYKDAIIIP